MRGPNHHDGNRCRLQCAPERTWVATLHAKRLGTGMQQAQMQTHVGEHRPGLPAACLHMRLCCAPHNTHRTEGAVCTESCHSIVLICAVSTGPQLSTPECAPPTYKVYRVNVQRLGCACLVDARQWVFVVWVNTCVLHGGEGRGDVKRGGQKVGRKPRGSQETDGEGGGVRCAEGSRKLSHSYRPMSHQTSVAPQPHLPPCPFDSPHSVTDPPPVVGPPP